MSLPVVDVGPLVGAGGDRAQCAAAIGRACRDAGFFYAIGHGIDAALPERLAFAARRFFARDRATKMAIAMERGGRAWRGYFPVGGELTSGVPDRKEGLYFGSELGADHPRVTAGIPLHGANLFPDDGGALRESVLAYMAALTTLGHALMEGVALSLGLPAATFAERFTGDPLVLFRIFNYPAAPAHDAWGVGEHTDYGLLTILKQDDAGGLEVRSGDAWVDAPPLADSFVCNIGDMLERLTRGRYRSTPHRVRNRAAHDRLSSAFFFDPDFDAPIAPLDLPEEPRVMQGARWDGEDVHAFSGTYGEYLMRKVGRVFPALRAAVEGPA